MEMVNATKLIDDKEAAPILGVQPNTLKNSRHTGRLAGVEAPPYLKMGRTVRYEVDALLAWRSQFEIRTSTGCRTHD